MVSILKRFFERSLPRRRRISFYESQKFMQQAIESVGFVDLIRFSDEELGQIITANQNSKWVNAARRELKARQEIRRKLGIGEQDVREIRRQDKLAAG